MSLKADMPRLEYGRCPSRIRARARRSLVAAALVLSAGLVVYGACWLRMASSAGELEILSAGGIHHFRFPPHSYARDVRYYLFEPAYRVDRWLRPDYWQGFKGVSEELP